MQTLQTSVYRRNYGNEKHVLVLIKCLGEINSRNLLVVVHLSLTNARCKRSMILDFEGNLNYREFNLLRLFMTVKSISTQEKMKTTFKT